MNAYKLNQMVLLQIWSNGFGMTGRIIYFLSKILVLKSEEENFKELNKSFSIVLRYNVCLPFLMSWRLDNALGVALIEKKLRFRTVFGSFCPFLVLSNTLDAKFLDL